MGAVEIDADCAVRDYISFWTSAIEGHRQSDRGFGGLGLVPRAKSKLPARKAHVMLYASRKMNLQYLAQKLNPL